ncbi:MAG: S8 family serine peptidase [Arenicella sp.]
MNKSKGIINFFIISVFSIISGSFTQASEVIPNQYIIVLKNQEVNKASNLPDSVDNNEESIQKIAERLIKQARENEPSGVNKSVQKNTLGFVYESAIQGFSAKLSPNGLSLLKKNPLIDYIEPDIIVSGDAVQMNPPWGLDRIDQTNLPLNNVFKPRFDGDHIRIYIIDSGIRASHNEFAGRAVGLGYDFIDNDNTPNDCNGHGTAVAGIAGGNTYGVAKNATIYSVKVLRCDNTGPASAIIAGIDWVRQNAIQPAVANMSIQFPPYQPVDTAINNAIAAGVTFVVSAGNNAQSACNFSPARVGNAITVAGSTRNDQRYSTSNFGSCVDIFAPGNNIRAPSYTSNTHTSFWTGTSMASPHVAGAAALLLDSNSSLTPAQIKAALIANSTSGVITNPGASTPNRLLYVPRIPIRAPEAPEWSVLPGQNNTFIFKVYWEAYSGPYIVNPRARYRIVGTSDWTTTSMQYLSGAHGSSISFHTIEQISDAGTYEYQFAADSSETNSPTGLSSLWLPINPRQFVVSNTDIDGDGVSNDEDNCPALANPAQANFDNDNLGDACDPDDDNDGMSDIWELQNNLNSKDPSDRNLDSDGDGFSNFEEYQNGTNPNVVDQPTRPVPSDSQFLSTIINYLLN